MRNGRRVRALAVLREEHRSLRGRLHGNCDADQERRKREQRGRREAAVEQQFRPHLHRTHGRRRQIDGGEARDIRHRMIEERDAARVRNQTQIHEIVPQRMRQTIDCVFLRQRQHEPHFVDALGVHLGHELVEVVQHGQTRAVRIGGCRDGAGTARVQPLVTGRIEQTDGREALLGRARQMREQRARKTLRADDRYRALIEAARAHRPQANIDDGLERHDQRAGYQRGVAEPQARHSIHAMQRIRE